MWQVFHAFFCFCLWLFDGMSGVHADETVMISVMEGDSVVLNTVTELQGDDHILWTFKHQNSETRIAEIYKQSISIYDKKENNERFRDRLQLDNQTGSLTITNITKLHSGLYKLQILGGDVKHMSFNTTAYGVLPVPVIIEDSLQNSSSSGSFVSICSLLCSVLNVSHVTLSWYKGNSLLSSISVSDLSISLFLPLEVEYQDKNTYSCVINNPITNQTTHLHISEVCQTSESSQSLFPTVFLLLLLVVTVIFLLIFSHRRNYTHAKHNARANEDEADNTKATFIPHRALDAVVNGRDQMEYTEVIFRRL